jgi:PAS domain S-box-containing protein
MIRALILIPEMRMNVEKAIVDQAGDAIIAADRQGAVLVWNAAAERLFGWSADEAKARGLDLIIPERFRAAHWAGYDRALESGKTKYGAKVLTTRSQRKDGSTLYVDLSFGLMRDDTGAVQGALAIARDVTERFLAEKARRAREAGAGTATAGT